MKVPDFIGYPGKQTRNAYGAANDFDPEYDRFVDDKIVIATLKPQKATVFGADANIFRNEDAWKDYTTDLDEMNIKPPNKNQIDIVISQLSPISRSYNNNYGDSTILPTGGFLKGGMREIAQLLGDNTEELEKKLKEKDSIVQNLLGKLVGGYNMAGDTIQRLAKELGGEDSTLANVGHHINAMLKQPQSKIGWPKMWQDCSFEQSYQLNTRLYCFSTENQDDYDNNIKAALAALELFVTPRSDEGALYIAPYILEFDIPGMLHFPQAYVSNMNVIEGGNEGDFAQTGRPNVIDVTMTIQNMYSISVNTKKSSDYTYPYRPSVIKDLIGLASGRNTKRNSSYTNNSSTNEGVDVSYDDSRKETLKAMSETDVDRLAREDALNPRKNQDAQQKEAVDAFNKLKQV